jgi:acetamidase/formamidase
MLPVWVDGALFSVGDAHAAQGDGEVCVTAIEMMGRVTLRFGLESGRGLREPRFRTRGPLSAAAERGPCYVTTANGPDLLRQRPASDSLHDRAPGRRARTQPRGGVHLCSVAVDLKISEIVDAPNWIVSAFLPETVFA